MTFSHALSRRLAGLAILGLIGTAAYATIAFTQEEDGTAITVHREDGRTFALSHPDGPPVRVVFLSDRSFRLHVLGDADEGNRVPEYMRVKADTDYAIPDVKIEAHADDVTFKTATFSINISTNERVIAVEVRTPERVLIDNWEINARRHTSRHDLQPAEQVFGFGDKRAALDQRGQRIDLLNRDAFASETNASYKNIPFFMTTAGYGVFFHNFHPTTVDVGATVRSRLQLNTSGGDMDFYVFLGEPKQVLSQYTELTGRPAMLPRWAFGYHQGKASYKGDDAFVVADEMRRRKLPLDVIYYDDWDDRSTSKEFINRLWARYQVRITQGFGMPMFGSYRGMDDSKFLRELADRGFVLTDQDEKPAIGPDEHVEAEGQPSLVAYLDYFSPKAVSHVFAAKWNAAIKSGAILGMVDFGEMDHVDDPDEKYWPSLDMTVEETRNLFGLAYAVAVVGGVQSRTGGRVTGMVRPGYAGTQRLGWSTTGDSVPTYRNFRAHTRAMLNLAHSGFSNVGQDIGGWDRKGPDILYARWFAAGTFHPFMWSHGQGDHEPYAHGPAVEGAARDFLELRYRLVPYLYSLHEDAHRTGVPMLRSVVLQEPAMPQAARIDDQFFVGDDLLVAPVFNDEGDRTVVLPKGVWYDLFGEQPPQAGDSSVVRRQVALDRLPVYVRAGAVVPLGPVMQHTGELPVDPLTVNVYGFAARDLSDEPRRNGFSLYEDDGISNNYQRGQFQRTHLRFAQTRNAVRFEVKAESGDGQYWAVPERAYRLQFHGVAAPAGGVRIDGHEIAGKSAAAAGAPSWSADAKGIVIEIPRSGAHDIVVEFDASADAALADGRAR